MFFGKWKKQDALNKKMQVSHEVLDKKLQTSFSNVRQDVDHVRKWIEYLHNSQDRTSDTVIQLNSQVDDLSAQISTLLTRDEIKQFVDEYYSTVNNLGIGISDLRNHVKEHISTIYNNQAEVFQRLQALTKIKDELKSDLILENSQNLTSFKSKIDEDVKEKFDNFEANMNSKIHLVEANFTQKISQYPDKESVFSRLDEMNRKIEEIQVKGPLQKQRSYLKEKIFKKVTRHSKEYVKSMLISLVKKYQKISGLNLREIVVEEQGIVSKSSLYRLLIEIEDDENIHVIHEGKEKHYIWAVNNAPISG